MSKLKAGILIILATMFATGSSRRLEPEINKVVAIAVDGIPERDADPFLTVKSMLDNQGFYTLWFGREQGCQASQKHNVSLPAYANFFSGTVDDRIKDNDFTGKIKRKTLFDRYLNSQLFTAWRPLIRVMSNSLELIADNSFITSRSLFPHAGDDDLVYSSFFKRYNGSRFAFVHFTDADNFGHLGRTEKYEQAIEKEAELSYSMIQGLEKKGLGNYMYIIFSDHSRGEGTLWRHHGKGIKGSGHIWILIVSRLKMNFLFPMCDHTGLNSLIRATLL